MTERINIWTSVLVITCTLMSTIACGNGDSSATSLQYGLSLGVHLDYEIENPNTDEGVVFNAFTKIGYSAGAIIRFNLKKDFFLETGIRWTALGTKYELHYPRRLLPNTTFELQAVDYDVNGYIFYLAIPIKPTFKFGAGNWKYSLSGGPIFNTRLGYNNKQLLTYEDGYEKDFHHGDYYLHKGEVIDAMDFGFGIGFGLERELNNNFLIQIAPEWEIYSIVGLDSNSSWSKYISSGIKVMITKK